MTGSLAKRVARLAAVTALAGLLGTVTLVSAPMAQADTPLPVVLPGNGIVDAPLSGVADLQVSVSLSKPSTQVVTVPWKTVDTTGAGTSPWIGPPAPPSDYAPSSGVVTFEPGQTTAQVTIPIIEDTRVISDPSDPTNALEYVVVSFNHPTGATIGGFWGLGFGVIDSTGYGPVPDFQYSQNIIPVPTGGAVVGLTVTLDQPTNHVVTVQWSTPTEGPLTRVLSTNPIEAGSIQQAPDDDYVSASGTVTFAPGETTETIPITVSKCTCPAINYFPGPPPGAPINGEVVWLLPTDPIGATLDSLFHTTGFGPAVPQILVPG
jgi:hypothetical protein